MKRGEGREEEDYFYPARASPPGLPVNTACASLLCSEGTQLCGPQVNEL